MRVARRPARLSAPWRRSPHLADLGGHRRRPPWNAIAGAGPRPASGVGGGDGPGSLCHSNIDAPWSMPIRRRSGPLPTYKRASASTRSWPTSMATGEALAGMLRQGNAGSGTAEDHVVVLDAALASVARLTPHRRGHSSHGRRRHLPALADACPEAGVASSAESSAHRVAKTIWPSEEPWRRGISADGPTSVTRGGGRDHRPGGHETLARRHAHAHPARRAHPGAQLTLPTSRAYRFQSS